jgi:hypothetical protein
MVVTFFFQAPIGTTIQFDEQKTLAHPPTLWHLDQELGRHWWAHPQQHNRFEFSRWDYKDTGLYGTTFCREQKQQQEPRF